MEKESRVQIKTKIIKTRAIKSHSQDLTSLSVRSEIIYRINNNNNKKPKQVNAALYLIRVALLLKARNPVCTSVSSPSRKSDKRAKGGASDIDSHAHPQTNREPLTLSARKEAFNSQLCVK